MVKFDVHSNPQDIEAHYQQHGFVVFKDIDIAGISETFRKEFAKLVALKFKELGLSDQVNEKTVFEQELMTLNRKYREEFSYVWNASQSLTSLFAMLGDARIKHLLELVGMKHNAVAWTPNLRIDCPNEDAFILPDHQDRHYNGGSENSCTVYFQINGISKEKGPLHVRPGTHKFGSIPYKKTDVRPYFFLEPGPWQDCADVELDLTNNDVLIFHMDLVHASGLNRSMVPRMTMQLRYNNLNDPLFMKSGWLPTYSAMTTKNNIGLIPVNIKE